MPASENYSPLARMQNYKASYRCNNASCAVRADLKTCSNCRSARYCSVHCQKLDWKDHKSICKQNASYSVQLSKDDTHGYLFPGLPRGLSLVELDQKLEKWVSFHKSKLMIATIHALRLRDDIRRSTTHLLRIQVRVFGTDKSNITFKITDAGVLDIASEAGMRGRWVEGFGFVESMRKKQSLDIAVAGIECSPLHNQIVPFIIENVKNTDIVDDWVNILMKGINTGVDRTQ